MEITGSRTKRVVVGFLGVSGLAIVYIIQNIDFLALFTGRQLSENIHFIINRSLRIVLNDCFMLMLIWALFRRGTVFKMAFIIGAIDLLILFPIYLFLKLPAEGASELSSPFLSQIHRLIVNPVLLILFCTGMVYQNVMTNFKKSKNQEKGAQV